MEIKTKGDLIYHLISLDTLLDIKSRKGVKKYNINDEQILDEIRQMSNAVTEALCDLRIPKSEFNLSNPYEQRAIMDKYTVLYKTSLKRLRKIFKDARRSQEQASKTELQPGDGNN